jgi:type IV pilus assembly protein PilA
MSNSPKSPTSTTNKVLIGVGVGCGCLTVVPIVLGIIAAIALPSFINQEHKSKEVIVIRYLNWFVELEQAYFLKNHQFTDNLRKLISSDEPDFGDYTYSLKVLKGKEQSLAMMQIKADSPARKSYAGAARAVGKAGEKPQEGIVCVTATASTIVPPFVLPARSSDPLVCPATMVQVQ